MRVFMSRFGNMKILPSGQRSFEYTIASGFEIENVKLTVAFPIKTATTSFGHLVGTGLVVAENKRIKLFF